MAATTKMVEELAELYVSVFKHDSLYITQEKYDRWIKNMSKNNSGTSWVFEPNGQRRKLFKNDDGDLYFINSKKGHTFLKLKSVEQEKKAEEEAAAEAAAAWGAAAEAAREVMEEVKVKAWMADAIRAERPWFTEEQVADGVRMRYDQRVATELAAVKEYLGKK